MGKGLTPSKVKPSQTRCFAEFITCPANCAGCSRAERLSMEVYRMKSGMGLGLGGLKLWRPALNKPAQRVGARPTVWPLFASLRSQLIIPYVVLTLLTAMIGTYIVTRLVTS